MGDYAEVLEERIKYDKKLNTKTLKEWAELLNNREYLDETSFEETQQMALNGTVAIYGQSDDLLEIEGIYRDELSCVLFDNEVAYLVWDCDNKWLEVASDVNSKYPHIEVIWAKDNISWQYKMSEGIEHETFNILEDGEVYCKGILFKLDDFIKASEVCDE